MTRAEVLDMYEKTIILSSNERWIIIGCFFAILAITLMWFLFRNISLYAFIGVSFIALIVSVFFAFYLWVILDTYEKERELVWEEWVEENYIKELPLEKKMIGEWKEIDDMRAQPAHFTEQPKKVFSYQLSGGDFEDGKKFRIGAERIRVEGLSQPYITYQLLEEPISGEYIHFLEGYYNVKIYLPKED